MALGNELEKIWAEMGRLDLRNSSAAQKIDDMQRRLEELWEQASMEDRLSISQLGEMLEMARMALPALS